ncbi:hypothetical protein GYH30_044849 [Glycine max]|nr:hypothetical protein GYH30_044849 [Glycine max]
MMRSSGGAAVRRSCSLAVVRKFGIVSEQCLCCGGTNEVEPRGENIQAKRKRVEEQEAERCHKRLQCQR